jgi:hypothetical protein
LRLYVIISLEPLRILTHLTDLDLVLLVLRLNRGDRHLMVGGLHICGPWGRGT